jgi:hypothetical protein
MGVQQQPFDFTMSYYDRWGSWLNDTKLSLLDDWEFCFSITDNTTLHKKNSMV